MSDLKVLGVKVKQDVYDEFKQLDGDVSTNLRHAVLYYLKHNKEIGLTKVNEEKNLNEYKHLAIELKSFKKDVSRFNQSLGDYGRENIPPLFGLVIDLTAFQLKIVELFESFLQIKAKELEPIEKIKAEQRKLSGKGLDGSGGRGKKKNLVANFPPGLDDRFSSDNTRFEQGKKLEQTEKPKKEILQEKGKTRDKSIWEEV